MSARRPAAEHPASPAPPQWVDRVLAEYAASPPRTGDAELDAIAAALFVEDVFAIAVRDDEISDGALGTPRAVETFVRSRLGLI